MTANAERHSAAAAGGNVDLYTVPGAVDFATHDT